VTDFGKDIFSIGLKANTARSKIQWPTAHLRMYSDGVRASDMSSQGLTSFRLGAEEEMMQQALLLLIVCGIAGCESNDVQEQMRSH